MKSLANEIIRVRINEQLKKDATVVLESIGLTMSDAIRIFLKRVVDEKAVPFALKMPAHLDISQMSKGEIDLAFEPSFKDFEEGCFCSSEEAFSRIKRRAAK
ncbi:type II toxin-antitoxin system RelB/DinJ family antitoxin [uncultured Parasutterella sp.]|uniref:type II toxin-antitoxin system RelB/DinJ family antitoxin n=1 Tax=uncultured Parasutterella sp. TaxID=1263098 RepID=UPI00259A33E5|nr:type II toxin-antitoxin system RelB/DinJ family antitoxin [uncultured Parasutterella sp.]